MASPQVPDHIMLTARRLSATLSASQTAALAPLEDRTSSAAAATASLSQTASTIAKNYRSVAHTITSEKAALDSHIHESCADLEHLNTMIDDIEANVKEMEQAVASAESALGMSFGGLLEKQIARLFAFGSQGANAHHGSSRAGVPYLRQWAPRELAIPSVVRVSEYFGTSKDERHKEQ